MFPAPNVPRMTTGVRRAAISAAVAVVASLVITWVSGFFRPLFPQMTVDVLQWGSPFPYLYRVVTFRGPPSVDWTMAWVDFIIWGIIVFLIVFPGWMWYSPVAEKNRAS